MARKPWWSQVQAEQLAIMVNTLAKIGGHASALGLSTTQVDRIEMLCNTYIAVYNWIEATRETAGSLTEWRDDFFYRPGGGLPPAAPTFLPYTGVAGSEAGVVTEFKATRDQIVNQIGFPEAIGDDLMWLGEESANIIPADVTPTVKATPAATDYLASIVVSGREKADGWDLYTLDKGASEWVKFGTYTGKSVDVTFTPTTAGEPYIFQLRVQLRKNNANYGNPSSAITVTVNP